MAYLSTQRYPQFFSNSAFDILPFKDTERGRETDACQYQILSAGMANMRPHSSRYLQRGRPVLMRVPYKAPHETWIMKFV